MPMTEDEKKEALIIAEGLGPVQICETLEDLVVRERSLLERPMDPDMRSITLHNVAVLTAACAGYAEGARKFREASAQAEKPRDDGKGDRVDEDP
jgi:hypothetical protein